MSQKKQDNQETEQNLEKTNEVVPISDESNELKEKKEKVEKRIPRKKFPSLMKKAMTKKAFDKRILKKLYIEDDRNFVNTLFSEQFKKGKKEKELVRIPLDTQITKRDFKRLKVLTKQIKKNKGRVKFVPLIACASFIVALVLVISAFKNVVAKKAIVGACEAIFSAKTDVQRVRVKLLGISLKIDGLAIGNKDSVMKNLFEAENITLQVNLTQALRGKFVAEDLSVYGMRFGTDRKTSCELPKKAEKEKKSIADSAFMKSLKAKSDKALDDLKSQAESLLGGGSVDEIVANIQSQLKTPLAAQNAKDGVQALSEKWKEKPAEMKTQVDDFSENVKDLQSLDVNSIAKGADIPTRVAALKDAIEKISTAIQTGNELKSSFEKTISEVKEDAKTAAALSEGVVKAAADDTALARGMVEGAVDTVKNAKQIFTHALDTVGYDMLGKYYPYAKKGIDYALQMKANAAAEKAANGGEKQKKEKKKKEERGRLKGTTIWFSKEYPGFLIKNIAASGYTDNETGKGFSGAIKELTSNQDLRGLPTTAEVQFDIGAINHAGDLTVDARSYSKEPLISVGYTGRGFTAAIDGANIAKASGVPSINGTAEISFKGTGGADGFSVSGTASLNPVTLTTDGFSNELITKYYRQALDTVKNLQIGFSAGYSETNGVDLSLSGNFADTFANAMKAVVESVMGDARAAAAEKINSLINDESNEVVAKAKEFLGIEGDIDVQNGALDTVRAALEAKKAELEQQVEEAAKAKINEAKEKATEEVNKQAEAAKSKATDAIKSSAGNLLKGLKK